MIVVLSLLLRCLSLLGVLVATNVVAPSTAWGYDAQPRRSTAYDGASLSAFDYDSGLVSPSHEKENQTAGTDGVFGLFAKLLAAGSLATPYAGIQQASQYLQGMGVSRADRVRILQSFEPQNMAVRQAGQSDFWLRFFSDPNRAGGQYLFETFPASRSSLGIRPEWNTMSGFQQFQIRPGATFLEGRAAAQGLYLRGGQMQRFLLDWRSDLIGP